MPLHVRRLSVSWVLILLCIFVSIFGVSAQTQPQSSVTPTSNLPTSADVMRARISKAKAYVAVKNYAAAIYELEGIRREINEPSVNGVVQVMLMNCYLEQMDYKRAQTFLTEIFNAQKANKPNTNYFAVAGQVVKGAKNQLERYRSLGLSVTDRNLPTEAAADVNKMRETVEMVVEQSKTLGSEKKLTADSMALLEEASNARSGLARDDYDAKRWKDEVADARENLANSRSTIINAVDDGNNPINSNNSVASNQKSPIIPKTIENTAQISPVPVDTKSTSLITDGSKAAVQTQTAAKNNDLEKTAANKPVEKPVEKPIEKAKDNSADTVQQPVKDTPKRERRVEKQDTPKPEETTAKTDDKRSEMPMVKDTSPLKVGSLIEYATEKINPTYPPAARTMRMTGAVRVELTVNEDGKVEVQNTSGPSLFQRAAVDAVKKWKFKPFVRDGQPVKATGYVSFNFNL